MKHAKVYTFRVKVMCTIILQPLSMPRKHYTRPLSTEHTKLHTSTLYVFLIMCIYNTLPMKFQIIYIPVVHEKLCN